MSSAASSRSSTSARASNDLINADYIIGLPLTFRRNGFSVRAKLYHQSSHLGDEYLLRERGDRPREPVVRVGGTARSRRRSVRFASYGGGERIFRREPDTLPDSVFHAGVELRTGRARRVQMLAGVDVEDDRAPRLVAGGERRASASRSDARAPKDIPGGSSCCCLEVYQGPSPYGQFFQDDISYIGAGIHFGL